MMTACVAIDELRRLLTSRERGRLHAVPCGVQFPFCHEDGFLKDATALPAICEEEPARQMRQRIILAVRRLVG